MLLCLQMQAQQPFTVMAYNVENAFDTIHDEGKTDEVFCAGGIMKWNKLRLFEKLRGICKVIAAADEHRPVDLIGLCEVENDTVMQYLTKRTPLAQIGYEYVMTNSDDKRGIDVALLYSPFTFHPVGTWCIKPNIPEHPTRDILHVAGTIANGDTVDVYVLHLPSKLGGAAALARSITVTRQLQHDVDSVLTARKKPNVIIMGDFNAGNNSQQIKIMTNNRLTTDITRKLKPGTYRWRGEWATLDHILVHTTSLKHTKARILQLPYLLEPDPNHGGKKPIFTYYGPVYHGGISDHLPVVANFRF